MELKILCKFKKGKSLLVSLDGEEFRVDETSKENIYKKHNSQECYEIPPKKILKDLYNKKKK